MNAAAAAAAASVGSSAGASSSRRPVRSPPHDFFGLCPPCRSVVKLLKVFYPIEIDNFERHQRHFDSPPGTSLTAHHALAEDRTVPRLRRGALAVPRGRFGNSRARARFRGAADRAKRDGQGRRVRRFRDVSGKKAAETATASDRRGLAEVQADEPWACLEYIGDEVCGSKDSIATCEAETAYSCGVVYGGYFGLLLMSVFLIPPSTSTGTRRPWNLTL